MGIQNPKSPLRADHRLIQILLQSLLGGKVEYVPKEFALVIQVFGKAGGSWERIFSGSPEDITLLKRILMRAFQSGRLTKKHQWGA